ncbi:MAG: hypothetical protein V2I62_04260 [Bacteroidales bacterium]|jgi:hypothetical protein|nr:hypothetical protein [Bacteroidales bacterium]
MQKEKVTAKTTIITVLEENGKKTVWENHNLITNDGDLFMAELLAGETPTDAFINCVLGTGAVAAAKTDDYDSITPISGSNKAPSAGYPKTNDTDADNTGAGADICTWKYEWTTGDFNNAAVREGCITIASPGVGSNIFNRWVEDAAYEKSSSATLTQYVNVTITGA